MSGRLPAATIAGVATPLRCKRTLSHQDLERFGLFPQRQVLALEVLDEREDVSLGRRLFPHDRRDLCPAERLDRFQSTVARDQLVPIAPAPAYDHWLQELMFGDAGGELVDA